MPVISLFSKAVSDYSEKPTIGVRFRILREGIVTADRKVIRVYRDWGSVFKIEMVFEVAGDDTEYSRLMILDQGAMLAQEDWLVAGTDLFPPKRTRAIYMRFLESGIYTFNITSGEGGGGDPGVPASAEGIVRVERQPADRSVILIERPDDGEWRIAGYGPTPGGFGEVPARVVGGAVFAISVDDWGVQFSPLLSVLPGQRIRPTQFSGWLYEITEPGVLPGSEPQWWAADGDNPSRVLGTARAVAVRYYRPLAHGPVTVEMI